MAERPIGFWLKLLDQLITELFEKTIDEHGVTRRQWMLLNVLARSGATVDQLNEAIAPFLEGTEESAVDHLTELIESAWADATPDGYELTDRGRTAFSSLNEVINQQRRHMTQGLSEEQYATTVAALETMARNLGFTD
jgi:DNA-binding MarR family transcriptional regulator